MARSLRNRKFFSFYVAKYEDSEFNAKVQALYNELRLRGKFEKARKGAAQEFIDVAE